MEINTSAKYLFTSASKWAKFISIYGFAACGLCVLFSISVMILSFSLPTLDLYSGISTFMLGFIYVIAAIIGFFPSLFLFRFAKRTRNAIETEDEELLAKGIDGLDSYFKFTGILYIITLVFIFVAMLFGIVAVVATVSAM